MLYATATNVMLLIGSQIGDTRPDDDEAAGRQPPARTYNEGESGIRIAVWSGPRNISTALMRSWDSRSDTYVCDEPFYAHYLARTGLQHPGRDLILREGETDWKAVVAWLTGPIPGGKRIFYQKHMAHHLLPTMRGEWLGSLRHAMLIRDPEETIISLCKVTPNPTLRDTGLPQQMQLVADICGLTGNYPPIVDARDVLERPEQMLKRLCEALGVDFDIAMLRWPAGKRETDGPWAPYWYANVESSTGFRPYRPPSIPLATHLRELERTCRSLYEELHRHRITV